VGILRAAIENGKTGRFITASEAIERVKDSYNTGGSYKLINKLTKRDLLIIDDLGAHKTSEHDSMVLHRIICGRYDNQNSTIITTNLSLAELEATIGERTVDRLRENNGMVIIMSWASYRSAKS
jgi:DNA replication protein DnaC